MSTIIILHNQSILDISIQYTGSFNNAFQIAVANGKAVSDMLVSGATLDIPDDLEINNDVLNYYKAKSVKPSTSVTDLEALTERRGIGWMKVATTFKVD